MHSRVAMSVCEMLGKEIHVLMICKSNTKMSSEEIGRLRVIKWMFRTFLSRVHFSCCAHLSKSLLNKRRLICMFCVVM